MAMFIIILMIAGLIDQLIEHNRPPRNKEAPILANRIAKQQQQEERSKAQPPADLAGVHSVEWSTDTGKIIDVQFEEL